VRERAVEKQTDNDGKVQIGQPGSSVDGVRFLTYAVSFVGLMAFLFAVYGLLGRVLPDAVFRTRELLSASDTREQASYYLATLLVATPLWLGFWRLAERRIVRSPPERDAPERRVYFALVFAIAATAALFALHTLLRVVLTLPGPHDTNTVLRDGAGSATRLTVYGAALFGYTRLAWRERPIEEPDRAHDCALYILTAFSLVFLSVGLTNAIAAIVNQIQGTQQSILLGSTPDSVAVLWGQIAAWIISGGSVWAVITRYDQSRPGARAFRVPYLYIVLGVSILITLAESGQLLYELVRRGLGYQTSDNWGFLHGAVPPLLVGAMTWAYYWTVLRHQAVRPGHSAQPGMLPWPRRWPLAGLSFVGLAITAPAAVALLWVVLDFLFKTHDRIGEWWRDTTSASITALLIGSAVWLPAWSILQRAANSDPEERATKPRRWLLGGITLIATLVAVSFAIALLWLAVRIVLGGPHDAPTISDMLKYLSAAVVAAALAAYHGGRLRGETRTKAGRGGQLLVAALLAAGGARTLPELSRQLGRRIEVLGYLTTSEVGPVTSLPALAEQLIALDASGVERVMLVLGPDGGTAYPFSRQQEL